MTICRRQLLRCLTSLGLAVAFARLPEGSSVARAAIQHWRPIEDPRFVLPGGVASSGGVLSLEAGYSVDCFFGTWEAGSFTGVGVRWRSSGSVRIRVRARSVSGEWEDWTEIAPSDHLGGRDGRLASDLLLGAGNAVEVSVTLMPSSSAISAIWDLEVTAIDAAAGPSAPPVPDVSAVAVGDRPPIVSRADWGCPEPYSSRSWPPVYRRVEKIMIHHTATSAALDGAQAVRTIYSYHAVTQGWGDIGYNFLIDSNGNIYEGRFGGDDVVAGHALCYNYGSLGVALIGSFDTVDISPAAEAALVRLLSWKCQQRSIDPTGASYFVDRYLHNICAHRDGNGSCSINTACPGARLYGRLPAIRTAVAAMLRDVPDREIGVQFESHTTPLVLGCGAAVRVTVTATNLGSLPWAPEPPSWIRLGYKWFRSTGTQYVQPMEEDRRTPVPRLVRYGETVRIDADLVAPREPGEYRLRWDLEQPGVRWFESDPRNQPLDVPVTVRAPVLAVSHRELAFLTVQGHDPAPMSIEVQNDGLGDFAWTVTTVAETPGWLHVAPVSATAPGRCVVTARCQALPAGVYYGGLVISANVPGVQVESSPQSIPVRLTIVDRLHSVQLPVVSQ